MRRRTTKIILDGEEREMYEFSGSLTISIAGGVLHTTIPMDDDEAVVSAVAAASKGVQRALPEVFG